MAATRAALSGSKRRVSRRSSRRFCASSAGSVSVSSEARRGIRWSGSGSRAMESSASARRAESGSDRVNWTSAVAIRPRTPALGRSSTTSDRAALPAMAPERSRRIQPSAAASIRKKAPSAFRKPRPFSAQAARTVAAMGSPLAASSAMTGAILARVGFSIRSLFWARISVAALSCAMPGRAIRSRAARERRIRRMGTRMTSEKGAGTSGPLMQSSDQ